MHALRTSVSIALLLEERKACPAFPHVRARGGGQRLNVENASGSASLRASLQTSDIERAASFDVIAAIMKMDHTSSIGSRAKAAFTFAPGWLWVARLLLMVG
jgi:hypothetical protein